MGNILGSLIIISLFGSSIKSLVDLATTISFMIAPFVAFANYKLVSTPYVGKENSPKIWLEILSYWGNDLFDWVWYCSYMQEQLYKIEI